MRTRFEIRVDRYGETVSETLDDFRAACTRLTDILTSGGVTRATIIEVVEQRRDEARKREGP